MALTSLKLESGSHWFVSLWWKANDSHIVDTCPLTKITMKLLLGWSAMALNAHARRRMHSAKYKDTRRRLGSLYRSVSTYYWNCKTGRQQAVTTNSQCKQLHTGNMQPTDNEHKISLDFDCHPWLLSNAHHYTTYIFTHLFACNNRITSQISL